MVSLFTSFVARGTEVPAVDPRIEGHIDVALVVDLSDERPAAPATVSLVGVAPEGIPTSTPIFGQREVKASDGEDTAF